MSVELNQKVDGVNREKSKPRIAVIGVHGIAHHDPGATADAMADLLLSLPPYNPAEPDLLAQKYFRGFRSVGIRVPLKPVSIDPTHRVDTINDGVVHRFVRPLQEVSAEFSRALVQEVRRSEGNGQASVDLKFSCRLLQDYQGGADGNVYVTNRLEGERTNDKERPDLDVHIYEMFWADLARPTNSVVSFFLAVFQLVLHLPSLSRLAVDTHAATGKLWKAYQFCQRYAARVLQIVLPMLKIVLLIALFAAAPAVAKVPDLSRVAAVLVATAAAGGLLLMSNAIHRPVYGKRIVWLVVSFLSGLIFGVVTYLLLRWNQWKQDVVIALVIWGLGSLLLWYALEAYQNTRPGISMAGWSMYALSFLLFWGLAARGTGIELASLWVTQWVLVLLRLSWLSLTVLAVAAFVLGSRVWRREKAGPEQSKARSAVRTSRLALALPAFLFVFTTGMIWAGLFSVANWIKGSKEHPLPYFNPQLVNKDHIAPWIGSLDKVKVFDLFPHPEIGDNFGILCKNASAQPDYLKGVLAWSLGYGTWIVTILVLMGLIVLAWWVLPSVLTERFPPRQSRASGGTSTAPPRSSTNSESVWLGAWVSRGLDSSSFVTYWIWSAVFLIPVILFCNWRKRDYFENAMKLVVCEVVAVAASAAVLASIVRYSSPVIRCILDVDTYLRTGPTTGTPRAKIFERFASLLRYVAQYRDAEGRGYDAVVIIAHSLGSLISADLLRLLNEFKNDEELNRLGFGSVTPVETIPIRLFTMGNPLRQLLNRFFPYLYDWVKKEPDNAMRELPAAKTNPPCRISLDARPDPRELGVALWVNAYRSGDYVGRSLWIDEWYRRTMSGDGLYPDPVHCINDSPTAPTRIEFCIGSGAHTHYWDDTAPDIALRLNELL